MKRFTQILTITIFALTFVGLAAAGPLTGLEIMQKAFDIDVGQDSFQKIEMSLIDKKGNHRQRLLEVTSKRDGGLRKRYIEFVDPAEIEGTRFLSLENEGDDETQYLYLPALGRARRIVSNRKKLRFVNTDYSYEDMERRRPDQDTQKLLREETWDGHDCYVVETIPAEGTSQYSKRVVWVDKESFFIVKADFYDKKGQKIKEYSVKNLEPIQGIWTGMFTDMKDLKEGHETLMKVIEARYNQGIDDNLFDLYQLEK